MSRLAAPLLALSCLVAACSGGGGDTVTTTSLDTDFTPVPEGIDADLDGLGDSIEPGQMRVVLGRNVDVTLDLSVCSLLSEEANSAAELLVEVIGSGIDGDLTYQAALRRFRSTAATSTITDTATVAISTGDDVIVGSLQAQRFEIDGVVTDTRDDAARRPLFQLGADTVEVHGLFSPPGSFDEIGLVQGAIAVRCEP